MFQEDKHDAADERYLWRQVRKQTNGTRMNVLVRNNHPSNCCCWHADYDDKAAELQLDLKRERTALKASKTRLSQVHDGQ